MEINEKSEPRDHFAAVDSNRRQRRIGIDAPLWSPVVSLSPVFPLAAQWLDGWIRPKRVRTVVRGRVRKAGSGTGQSLALLSGFGQAVSAFTLKCRLLL